MIVCVGRLVLAIPGNDSLKGKRRIVKSIVDRVHHRFRAAAAEVGALDQHREAVLGFAVVSNESRHANEMMDQVMQFVTGASEAVVVDRSLTLFPVGTSAMEAWRS